MTDEPLPGAHAAAAATLLREAARAIHAPDVAEAVRRLGVHEWAAADPELAAKGFDERLDPVELGKMRALIVAAVQEATRLLEAASTPSTEAEALLAKERDEVRGAIASAQRAVAYADRCLADDGSP